jgi:hypothetical protein
MQPFPIVRSWVMRFPAVVLAGLLLTAGVHAQARFKDIPKEFPEAGTEALTKEWNDVSSDFNKLASGDTPVKGDKALAIVKTGAQWYTYRLTWNLVQAQTKPYLKVKRIQDIHAELETLLRIMANSKNDTKKFQEVFTQEAMTCLKQIFKEGNLRAKVNAGVMMVRLAKTGRLELIKEFLDVLQEHVYLAELFQKDSKKGGTGSLSQPVQEKLGKLIGGVPLKASPAQMLSAVERYEADIHKLVAKNQDVMKKTKETTAEYKKALASNQEAKKEWDDLQNLRDVMEQTQYDPIKLYALKALSTLFEYQRVQPKTPADFKARLGLYAPALKVVLTYVDQKPNIPDGVSPEERDRILGVVRYFRREAIHALANSRVPAGGYDTTNRKVIDPVAYWLLRVVTDDSDRPTLKPPASMSEKAEAAFGLLMMRDDAGSPYQPDVAVYAVARFIQTDLAPKYNDDETRTFSTPVEKVEKRPKERSKELKKLRSEPWKIHALRLGFALEEMQKAAVGKPLKDNIGELKNASGGILRIIGTFPRPSKKNPNTVKEADLAGLSKLVETLAPKDPAVYKGFDLKIKVGG